jgi:hypothetical protein
MGAQEMIDLILEYARTHPDFDTDFVEQMQDWLGSGRELTDGQYSALERIVERYRL